MFIFMLLLCIRDLSGITAAGYSGIYYPKIDGYLTLHEASMTYDNALTKCLTEGAELAAPINEGMFNAMLSIIKTSTVGVNCGVFTGIHATYTDGEYYSNEGIAFHRPLVPMVGDRQFCKKKFQKYITLHVNGSFSDANENDSLPFICYKKKQLKNSTNFCSTHDSEYKFETRTGSCYKFHKYGQTWIQADKTCANEGGYLAVINSKVESKVLQEIFAKHPSSDVVAEYKDICLIGFVNWHGHGIWTTIFGQPLKEAGYFEWAPNQPNNLPNPNKPNPNGTTNELCGAIDRVPDESKGTMDDIWCDGVTFSFICERPSRLHTD